MRNLTNQALLLAGLSILSISLAAQNNPAPSKDKAWVVQSNAYTQLLINIDEKYSPEFGTEQGIAFYDTLISVPTLANKMAERKDRTEALAVLKTARQKETDLAVKQDLDILVNQTELGFRQDDFENNKEVSYLNATNTVFDGIQTLLDDQVPEERRKAAVIRLRKYAGLEKDYQSITSILQQRTMIQMAKPGMIYPSKQELEVTLSRNAEMIEGIQELCTKYHMADWQDSYVVIKKQLEDYDKWVKENMVPKARMDFRLPPEQYALALEGYGIDIPPGDLAKMAHTTFTSIQDQMKDIAARIAKKYKLPSADYRSVLQVLKKDQIHGDSIMIVYKAHLTDIENIIRTHHLVTLPNRAAIIRLASAAETAQQPAPHMVPPPFLNNTGQRGVFVLPLNMPAAFGETTDKYDDFTFDAASWTIIAHEVRPGHELQFDKMVEEGVSQARALYAFNSTNVEGWALYSEYITLPFMPEEGQLVSLDYRLLRAARAFLDPELQAGTINPQQAMDILMNDVLCSHAMAKQEVERYTLRSPGQANSYYYGFIHMIELRKETENVLGTKFNQQHFHDFILSQGILPPALIKQAVVGEFIPREKQN